MLRDTEPYNKMANQETEIQEFVDELVEKRKKKLPLSDFFKLIHGKFFSYQDISFMDYFLELTKHRGKFVVHHEKLVEYGIMSSNRSSNVRAKLDLLGLVENDHYNLLDILQVRHNRGNVIKKVYMLTPESFKKCLMRSRKYPNQTVDPEIYADYYLLLYEI